MAELNERLSKLNPFKPEQEEEDEDRGEDIDRNTVAGSGHAARQSNLTKSQLRVSRALRSFLAREQVLSEEEAGVGSDEPTPALQELVTRSHIQVPEALTDRSYPLPEYFISSSHNTYLIAHQLYGASSAEAYETALRTGSRCVEIDAWDNDDDKDEPKVTHGYTLVSHIPFRAVCETIRDVWDQEAAESVNAQGYRASPIILSLENHCGEHGQLRLVHIMKEVFGDRLLSRAIREEGHEEQMGGDHVTLDELGSKIAVIVEYHIPGEVSDSESSSDEEDDNDEKAYKDKKKSSSKVIVPELAELGVYAQSVKPSNDSWYLEQELRDGPHHHLINVSESGLQKHLPENAAAIAKHNAHHLMRVFPKGTRIGSDNLKPVGYWGIGAQICALNWQNFGTSNQLNEALFSGSDGYVLKPAALRAGGSGVLNGDRKKKLRLHVAGATDIPLRKKDEDGDSIRPYLTCALYHPDDLKDSPPKRKTSHYKPHRLGFLHHGENPPPTDPLWDEILEWEYWDSELVFLRLLIKSDQTWTKNFMLAVTAVRLQYLVPGWSFIPMLDMKGGETKCTVLVKCEITDA